MSRPPAPTRRGAGPALVPQARWASLGKKLSIDNIGICKIFGVQTKCNVCGVVFNERSGFVQHVFFIFTSVTLEYSCLFVKTANYVINMEP